MVGQDESRRARSERVVVWQRCVTSPHSPDKSDVLTTDFTDKALSRARAAGAEVFATVGSSFAVAFDSIEIEDAVELARSLVEDARKTGNALHVSFGVALGEAEALLEPGKLPIHRGSVIDRAQELAHMAQDGEVIVDEAALLLAREHFLFGREVSSPHASGATLDVRHARKRDCRKALRYLQSRPLLASEQSVFEELRDLSAARAPARVILHASEPFAALELIDRLSWLTPSALCLRVARRAGGLEPLGGLALALDRVAESEARSRLDALPAEAKDALERVRRGAPVVRAELVRALVSLLQPRPDDPTPPLLVLDQLHEIDPATLGVIAETLLDPDCGALTLMTAPASTPLPAALAPVEQTLAITLPDPNVQERRTLAESLLSLPEGSEIAQRVAALGGQSALGVMEAARTLVSSGDLVQDGATFVWRGEPRVAAAVPVEALLTERVAGLSSPAYRLLELLCVAPPEPPTDLVDEVLARDGLQATEIGAARSQLEAEGFIDARASLGHTDTVLRSTLRNQMPPARAAELHRFVADALRKRLSLPSLASAQLAYHLAEGGQEAEGARALIEAARAAADASFHRVALRLLAAAVELDGSSDVRRDASEAARGLDGLPQTQSQRRTTSENPARKENGGEPRDGEDLVVQAAQAARAALLAGDHDAVERCLDAAVAAGLGRAAAQRVLAVSQLARSEVHEASLTLARNSSPETTEAQARDALCRALLALGEGHPERAVREALKTLGGSRELGDGKGELAALTVLARCYRSLGRAEDAARIGLRATKVA